MPLTPEVREKNWTETIMVMAEALREREEPAWTVARAPPTVPEVEAVTEVPTADETTAATEAATVVLRA